MLKLDEAGPQEIANLWWALGSMRWQLGGGASSRAAGGLTEELAGELRVRLWDLNVGETAMVLWALARTGLRPRREALVGHLRHICSSSGSVKGRGGWPPAGAQQERADGEGPMDELSGKSVAAVTWSLGEMEVAACRVDDGTKGSPRRLMSSATRTRTTDVAAARWKTGSLARRSGRTAGGREARVGTWLSRMLSASVERVVLPCRHQASGDKSGTKQGIQGHKARESLASAPSTPSRGHAAYRFRSEWSSREVAICLQSCGRMRMAPPRAWLWAAMGVLRGKGSANPSYTALGGGVEKVAAQASVNGEKSASGLPTERRSATMTVRDAASAAAGLGRVVQILRAARQPLRRRRSDAVGWARRGARSTVVAAVRRCALRLVRLAAAAAESDARRGEPRAGRAVSSLLCALPTVLGSPVAGAAGRECPSSFLRSRTSFAATAFVGSCEAELRSLLSVCRESLVIRPGAPGAEPRQLLSCREAAAVALAAAKLGLVVDDGFLAALMACMAGRPLGSEAAGSEASPQPSVSTSLVASASPSSPSCRDWLVGMWAVERLRSPEWLLADGRSRRWLTEACLSVASLLSRSASPVMRPLTADETHPRRQRALRARHIANRTELRYASHAASRLANAASSTRENGSRRNHQELALLLRRTAWTIRRVMEAQAIREGVGRELK